MSPSCDGGEILGPWGSEYTAMAILFLARQEDRTQSQVRMRRERSSTAKRLGARRDLKDPCMTAKQRLKVWSSWRWQSAMTDTLLSSKSLEPFFSRRARERHTAISQLAKRAGSTNTFQIRDRETESTRSTLAAVFLKLKFSEKARRRDADDRGRDGLANLAHREFVLVF